MHSISALGFYQGAVMSAISGIEMALWDITGQDLGCPIWQLLGGKFRDRIRLYNDCHEGEEDTPEGGVETAKAVEARGFDAIKFDIDPRPSRRDAYNRTISNDDIDQFVRVVAAVREALDSNTDLLIHAHWFYAPPDILKVAKAFESLNLMWLEEPVPPENIAALSRITESTSTPICAGENLYLRYGFRDLLEEQAVDIIMPDISKCGGLSECRKIANMAEIYYIPFAPHNNSSALSTVGDAHVCASVPNFLALEFHRYDDPTWNDVIVSEEPAIQQGHVVLSEKPGLGVELNEEFLQMQMGDGEPLWQ